MVRKLRLPQRFKNQFDRLEYDVKTLCNEGYFKGFLPLRGNYWIIGDIHGRLLKWSMMKHLCDLAKISGVNKLIIDGDFWDQAAFSKFPVESKKTPFEEECNFLEKLLKLLLDTFEKVYILAGNHDLRLFKMINGEITLNRQYRMLVDEVVGKRLFISTYHYCELNDSWHITHPGSYAKRTGTVARELAHKLHKNIINAHGHMTGINYDMSGDYMGIDIGGMLDWQKTDYIALRDTTHPRWVPSFVLIYNNYPYMYTDNKTDWKIAYKQAKVFANK